jgi:serine/threonine protein kinase
MEFVQGVTLREELRLRGRLPVDEVAHILGQVADALDAAHRAGLVHRDVRPDNVMLESRPGGVAVKVLDFGIAKLVSASGDTEHLTIPHAIIGTPVYMSPEQARGDVVDARTDIYSLGVMVYEMLSGCVPFSADTPVALALKHVTDPPPPLRSVAPEVPEHVEAIILNALAKKPDERPPTALDLAHCFWASASDAVRSRAVSAAATLIRASALDYDDLAQTQVATSESRGRIDTPATPAPATGRVMVAVLPLRALSTDRNDELFASGLMEELLTSLSSADGVGVISRTSTERFRDSTEALPAIGARLGASFVIEGSVRRAGDRVRVAAQLICVERDTHVWAGTFDRDLDDVLSAQSDLAERIVDAVKAHLARIGVTTG